MLFYYTSYMYVPRYSDGSVFNMATNRRYHLRTKEALEILLLEKDSKNTKRGIGKL